MTPSHFCNGSAVVTGDEKWCLGGLDGGRADTGIGGIFDRDRLYHDRCMLNCISI